MSCYYPLPLPLREAEGLSRWGAHLLGAGREQSPEGASPSWLCSVSPQTSMRSQGWTVGTGVPPTKGLRSDNVTRCPLGPGSVLGPER